MRLGCLNTEGHSVPKSVDLSNSEFDYRGMCFTIGRASDTGEAAGGQGANVWLDENTSRHMFASLFGLLVFALDRNSIRGEFEASVETLGQACVIRCVQKR